MHTTDMHSGKVPGSRTPSPRKLKGFPTPHHTLGLLQESAGSLAFRIQTGDPRNAHQLMARQYGNETVLGTGSPPPPQLRGPSRGSQSSRQDEVTTFISSATSGHLGVDAQGIPTPSITPHCSSTPWTQFLHHERSTPVPRRKP